MSPFNAVRSLTTAVLIGSLVLLFGCASAARVDVQPIDGSALAPDAHELGPALDGLLRTLGYERESESSSKSVRDHGAYWKSLPPSGGESLLEIWYKVTKGAKIEVRLLTNPKGVAVAVFTEDPQQKGTVDTDANSIQKYLDTKFPGYRVSIQKWHPWPPA